MASIVVSVEYGQHQRKDLGLPMNIPNRVLAEAVSQALHQPEKEYVLMQRSGVGMRRLAPNASLAEAGLLNGAILVLQEAQLKTDGGSDGPCLRSELGDNFKLKIPVTLIGRPDLKNNISADVDLTPFDARKVISRRHASIYCEENTYFVQDDNSVNGTFLNGKRLQPRQRTVLSDGDVIEFGLIARGGVQMTFKER